MSPKLKIAIRVSHKSNSTFKTITLASFSFYNPRVTKYSPIDLLSCPSSIVSNGGFIRFGGSQVSISSLHSSLHPSELLTLTASTKCPKESEESRKGKGKKSVPHPRAPEDMVNAIDLSGPEAQITETPVAKTFGLLDMYRDFENAKQQHIEEQLLFLESQAGRIISTIRKDFEAGKQEVWLTRGQRDKLRKFLFILKYRGSTAYRHFYHGETDCSNAKDALREQEKLTAYMKEKKVQKRTDVWFDNIKAILELKMDPNLKWMEEIRRQIYPDDAEWFINITQQFYLAICTPSVDEDEFLLTQNAYSMHEGRTSQEYCPMTGEVIKEVYSQFHVFAPIAPRLIFVLRNFLLPNPLEDASPNIKTAREGWFHANKIQHTFPERFDSVLKDLPVTKARNSYTEIVGGRLVLISDKPRSATDKFCFRYFPIGTEHVGEVLFEIVYPGFGSRK